MVTTRYPLHIIPPVSFFVAKNALRRVRDNSTTTQEFNRGHGHCILYVPVSRIRITRTLIHKLSIFGSMKHPLPNKDEFGAILVQNVSIESIKVRKRFGPLMNTDVVCMLIYINPEEPV